MCGSRLPPCTPPAHAENWEDRDALNLPLENLHLEFAVGMGGTSRGTTANSDRFSFSWSVRTRSHTITAMLVLRSDSKCDTWWRLHV